MRFNSAHRLLRSGNFSFAHRFLIALSIALTVVATIAAKTARISGVIYTIGADKVQTLWPNARVTLKNLSTHIEVSTVSNDLGKYSFSGVLPGEYEIKVTLAGFETAVKHVTLDGEAPAQLDFQLAPEKQKQSVQVSANSTGVDLTSSNGGGQVLSADTLKSAVRLSQDFQEALPLLPGVVRGLNGEIRIKGGRTNQSSTLVDTASVADPYTGQTALKLPTVAVQSVQVLSNPFSAEYGKFASGVVDVNTRGGTDEWKYLFADPIPRFRWIDYHTHGVESASPHFVFSGPIKRGKLYIFQSLAYGYDVLRVPSLPNPNNVRIQESIDTYTKLDWDATPNHRFTAVFITDPQNTKFANINTFNPEPVTTDYHQRGFFVAATHRWILQNGGFVQSVFAVKRLDFHFFPATTTAGEMTLFPEQNSGTFFESQRRRTRLFQWSQALHLRPLQSSGRHLITTGYSYARSTFDGVISNTFVNVLREDSTLSSTIAFAPAAPSSAVKNELSFFVQDNWQVQPRFTFDLGVRLDSDSLSAESANISPRAGFVFAPTHDNRTAIRGGFGVFYDKIPLNIPIFPLLPAQTITHFAADGATIIQGPLTYAHVIDTHDGQLRLPYSLGWNLQFDRELRPGLLIRFGYESREVFREFYVDPFTPTASGEAAELRLFNNGRQSYREFLWMLRWKPTERTSLYASYVLSKARGEINDYNQFFGNFPYPLIRPNEFGRLSSDAPNRLLAWGIIGLPHKLQAVPVVDIHTGFPFSKFDANWNYVGPANEAGRFPVFVGVDMKVQYPFNFKYRGHHFEFVAGLHVIDAINHFQPRDVQQNIASPNFGTFYNSVGRLWRIDGDFDF